MLQYSQIPKLAVSPSILLARHFQNKALRDRYFLTELLFTFLLSTFLTVLVFLGMAPLLTVHRGGKLRGRLECGAEAVYTLF